MSSRPQSRSCDDQSTSRGVRIPDRCLALPRAYRAILSHQINDTEVCRTVPASDGPCLGSEQCVCGIHRTKRLSSLDYLVRRVHLDNEYWHIAGHVFMPSPLLSLL